MKKLALLGSLAILIPALCYGEIHEQHSMGSVAKSVSGVAALSPPLRTLFSQEMLQLQLGMTDIIPLYISGRWPEIAAIASKMEASYVLKQNLSAEQMHELHSKLPDAFIELDQQFHYLAGMLAHAAKMEKVELVGFYFSEMGKTCVSCHTQFASHKFPALTPGKKTHSH